METITRAEFEAMLINSQHNGATPVSMLVDTEVKGEAKRKLQKVNGFLNVDYEGNVQKATGDKEFKAQPRKWGVHISPCVIEHKGARYVQVRILGKRPAVYYCPQTGKLVAPPVNTRKASTNPIKIRTYKTENVRFVNINHKQYRVIG